MGSRMMHLIIANQVFEKLEVHNQQGFLLGGIAPDAAFTRNRKSESHFYEGHLDDGTRCVNYSGFIEKYDADIQNEFMLGYVTHLVSDDVWMKSIYFKNDFNNRLQVDPNLLKRWHNDFRKLNGKLIERFDCADVKEKLIGANTQINSVSEINEKDLQIFTKETLSDFTYNKKDLDEELQVFNVKEINDYIGLATNTAINVCRAVIFENKKMTNLKFTQYNHKK